MAVCCVPSMGGNLNRFGESRKPCVGHIKGPAPLPGRRGLKSTGNCYLEGELEEELVLDELPVFFLWWCFFVEVEDDDVELDGAEDDGVEEDDAGGLAKAVPAIRAAAAKTGIRCLNIIAVLSEKKDWCVRWELKRPYYAGNPFSQAPYDRNVMLASERPAGA
jgi:hypothetical protein